MTKKKLLIASSLNTKTQDHVSYTKGNIARSK